MASAAAITENPVLSYGIKESGNLSIEERLALGNQSEDNSFVPPLPSKWEEVYYTVLWTYFTPIIFAIITLVGCIGNSLVIYIIITRHTMHNTTNYLLLNLGN